MFSKFDVLIHEEISAFTHKALWFFSWVIRNFVIDIEEKVIRKSFSNDENPSLRANNLSQASPNLCKTQQN